MAEFLGVVELGTLYKNGVELPLPTRPWSSGGYPGSLSERGNGNIPLFTEVEDISKWAIGNTSSNTANKLKWIKIKDGDKTLLVCDRVILNSISWDDLNNAGYVTGKEIIIDGSKYKCRLLTGGNNYRSDSDSRSGGNLPNEYDRFVENTDNIGGLIKPSSNDVKLPMDYNGLDGDHNQLWHWWGNKSWCQEVYVKNTSYRIQRGFSTAIYFDSYYSNKRLVNIGWRPVLEVLNSAPIISDEDKNLGYKGSGFSISYTVNDENLEDSLIITESLDGEVIKIVNGAIRNQSYMINVAVDNLSMGEHTISINVTDGKGGVATRVFNFIKEETKKIKLSLKEPFKTDIKATKILVTTIWNIVGATSKVEACNNAYDELPTWEDITSQVMINRDFNFTNENKTADKWGINIRITVEKNPGYQEEISISGFGGAFE